jgi:GxxExxY protein
MLEDDAALNRISNRIIVSACGVIDTLGYSFLEKIRENALAHQLHKSPISAARQHAITARYDDIIVAEYFGDILIELDVAVELKAVKVLDRAHNVRCINYLKASGLRLRLCPSLNFDKLRAETHRVVSDVCNLHHTIRVHLRASAVNRLLRGGRTQSKVWHGAELTVSNQAAGAARTSARNWNRRCTQTHADKWSAPLARDMGIGDGARLDPPSWLVPTEHHVPGQSWHTPSAHSTRSRAQPRYD